MFCLFFPYLPSRRSILWSTFQKNRELFTKMKILLMPMTESAHWTQKHELLQILHGSCFRTNTVDKNGHKTTSILMSKTTWPAIEPNFPPILSLSFNAFCSKAQVKMLFVSEWNHVCHCFCVAQGEKGQGDDAPRCQIASKGDETESRSEHDVKESPLWRRWKSCQGGQ